MLVAIHYAEIGLKGKNRLIFEQQLVHNIRYSLLGLRHDPIRRKQGRIVIEIEKRDFRKISKRLLKVFGIAWFAPAEKCESDPEKIAELAKSALGGAKHFKIESRRVWKGFRLNSIELNRYVGERLSKFAKVKLKGRVKKIYIDVLREFTLIYTRKFKGLGGLPVGSGGKVLALISGGIDSPVAGLFALKRGCGVVWLHCWNEKMGGYDKMRDLMDKIAEYQQNAILYIIPFNEIQNEVIAKVPAKYRMIVYRRFMFRLAEKLAEKLRAYALVTGESLGQVASQTIENISVIQQSIKIPVLRPLIGLDKQEIVDFAKKFGTFEISIRPYQDCCVYMVAKHPVTKAKLERVLEFEKEMDIEALVKTALKKCQVYKGTPKR